VYIYNYTRKTNTYMNIYIYIYSISIYSEKGVGMLVNIIKSLLNPSYMTNLE